MNRSHLVWVKLSFTKVGEKAHILYSRSKFQSSHTPSFYDIRYERKNSSQNNIRTFSESAMIRPGP
ncbi:MAG TPA: hypothetical protein VNI77_05525 [Nitrososphaera sp.]|nr:hypothetical protein [Nitrososphaera sp.]